MSSTKLLGGIWGVALTFSFSLQAQSSPSPQKTACRPGTFYRSEYELTTKRDDFEASSMTVTRPEELTLDPPNSRESFAIAPAKFAPDKGAPAYRISIFYRGIDTVSIKDGEPLIMLIGADRQTLRAFASPRNQLLADGASAMALYDIPRAVLKAIAYAQNGVRARVQTSDGNRDFIFSPDSFCSFGRFYSEAVAGP